MRVLKDGKLRLDKNERRIGNFIIRDEETHVKVMDINQVFTHRADKRTPVGIFLEQCFETLSDEGVHNGLHNWLVVIFTAFSVIPDPEWLTDIYNACEACMKRHPEAYGMPATEGTEEENAQAEAEMKEMMEFEKDLKEMPNETPADNAS